MFCEKAHAARLNLQSQPPPMSTTIGKIKVVVANEESLMQICFDSTNIVIMDMETVRNTYISVQCNHIVVACYIYRSTLKKLTNHSKPWL